MKEEILKLYSEGLSYGQIQKRLNCSKGAISYHIGIGQKDKVYIRNKDRRSKIRKFIQEYKHMKPCSDCREPYPYWIMEFDHTSDNKLFNLGSFSEITISLKMVKDEIAKCDLVCSNCHSNRTFRRLLTTGNSASEL